jgi:hypothetical protein
VIEALFRNIPIILLVSNLFSFSYDYVILNNYIPYEESKNNLGIQLVEIDNNKRYYLNYQSWITDNFYIDGYISQYSSPIDILYGASIGYKSDTNLEYFKEIVYSIGYTSKRFSDENISLSNLSITQSFDLRKIRSFFSLNYLFNNYNQSRSITLKFLKSLNKNISIQFGIDYNDDFENINSILGINYKL